MDDLPRIHDRIQQMMGELHCDPADFKGRIIFMSMFNDIVWDAKGNEELCEHNSKRIGEYAQRFLAVIGLSLDLVQKRSGTAHTMADKTDVGIRLWRK